MKIIRVTRLSLQPFMTLCKFSSMGLMYQESYFYVFAGPAVPEASASPALSSPSFSVGVTMYVNVSIIIF